MDNRLVYYLPGYGGRLETGLGEGLLARDWNVTGRATVGDFRAIPFQQQVQTVADDLREHFWHADAHVVANSFGAYLFLHAQALLQPYIGKVLLLSPIVGEFSDDTTGSHFCPPYADRLDDLFQSGQYPTPVDCEIHVGKDDWQSKPEKVQAIGKLLGIKVTVVPATGHMLGKAYVGSLLDLW